MSDAIPHRVRGEPEFAKIGPNFQMTYETHEVVRVLRLTKDKARKSPEEQVSWSQLRRPGVTPSPSNSAMHCRRIGGRPMINAGFWSGVLLRRGLNLLDSSTKANLFSLLDWIFKPSYWNKIDIKASLISLID